ncbi:hypothetical protein EST38_g10930 [Candolleomyces aberdarensis]|uniref:Uncharacterized protein n=1 Tax=Candolleomyces aberdarensis TaxID=2316362 RepID=A0A4Q2D7R7_9AGAR|nr:hypothetical protein EST38_g10930 [Candolleomyces aberdarensis]
MPRANKENERPATAPAPSPSEVVRRQLLGKRKASQQTTEDNSEAEGEHSVEYDIGPQRKIAKSDKLISYGRHFGRTIHSFCNMNTLVAEGQARINELILRGIEPEHLSQDEQRDHKIFRKLINLVPDLEARLWDDDCTTDEKGYIADTLEKGMGGARSDDNKGLKSAIVDMVTPANGVLVPTLARNKREGRGFLHEITGKYLCPTDYDWNNDNDRRRLRSGEIIPLPEQWPIFLYQGLNYNASDPWEGLLKGHLLVMGFKHVFTSPSSVTGEARATRSGNAAIHGMKRVTTASLAYVAMMVRHALSSSAVFNKADKVMQNEVFYNSILSFLDDEKEGNLDSARQFAAGLNETTNHMLSTVIEQQAIDSGTADELDEEDLLPPVPPYTEVDPQTDSSLSGASTFAGGNRGRSRSVPLPVGPRQMPRETRPARRDGPTRWVLRKFREHLRYRRSPDRTFLIDGPDDGNVVPSGQALRGPQPQRAGKRRRSAVEAESDLDGLPPPSHITPFPPPAPSAPLGLPALSAPNGFPALPAPVGLPAPPAPSLPFPLPSSAPMIPHVPRQNTADGIFQSLSQLAANPSTCPRQCFGQMLSSMQMSMHMQHYLMMKYSQMDCNCIICVHFGMPPAQP